ncbi:enterotoxin A family protein [Caballeronia sp. LZ035]|uniref:enterotoxin A family protein n=1 Tax=Caballeronia sp. LZ035 TaxID=3038568 RepID=UPI00285B3792|nr:enterotoxin A family protein [Caballeronia sp. LZ035]MDR5756593.1 enterotoxin A family protein [Caballeronia sp. LZ035]
MDVSRVSGARPGAGSFAVADADAALSVEASDAQGAGQEPHDSLPGATDPDDARASSDTDSAASANDTGTLPEDTGGTHQAGKTDQPVQSTASLIQAREREDDVAPSAASPPLSHADVAPRIASPRLQRADVAPSAASPLARADVTPSAASPLARADVTPSAALPLARADVTPSAASPLARADVAPSAASPLARADVAPSAALPLARADVTPSAASPLARADVTPSAASPLARADVTPSATSPLPRVDVTPSATPPLPRADVTPPLPRTDVTPSAPPPLPRADITAASLPSHSTATEDPLTRVKRGACQGAPTNAEIFRERRGGDRLRARAADCVKFDQFDYQKKCRYPETGACDGIVLEAMRRIDRSAQLPDRTLFSEVQGMRNDADADSTSVAHRDFCEHVDNFQTNAYRLGFSHYTPLVSNHLKARYAAPAERLRAMRDEFALMQPADMAYLQIGMEASGTLQERGHALLVQREESDRWTIFDPNNGAFQYGSRTDMQRSLESYLDVAFSGTEWQASPVQMQVYSRHGLEGYPPAPVLASRAGTPGSNPPESDYDYQLYADTALRPYPLTPAAIFEGANQPLAGVDRNEALASHALRMVGDYGMPDFRSALEPLDPRAPDQARRLQLVDSLRRQHGSTPTASSVDVARFIRHAGESAIGSAEHLINNLATNFGSNYFGDSATRGSPNTMVVIDLARQTPPADESASGFARSDPLLIRRITPGDDYRRDRYELLAPDYGVFDYADFEHMTSAVRRAFLSGRHTEGGVRDAATTWYAEDSDSAAAGRAALFNARAALNLSFPVVPVADLPPPVATALPLPSGAYPHADFKRTAQQAQAPAEPRFLLRPSTTSPQEMSADGGFAVPATSLKDVNLVTHNFDVGSGTRDPDSAGFLSTFANPAVALDRLKSQSREGYVYAISPGPNLVDVNASLGRFALAPNNREFAAMGTIDATQVIGWWEVKSAGVSRFTSNPAYRWDVYGTQTTAGAQPQLARFPLDSAAWRDAAYSPRVMTVRDGGAFSHTPKVNPNLTQLAFYSDAIQTLAEADRRQAAHEEYRGPMTLHAYGGGVDHPAILYADASDNVYVNWTYRASTRYASNIKQFVMGSDGRFHYPREWNKSLRVGSDGYLYVGPVPSTPSLNGVFRYFNGRLVHVEDGKFLTVGHSVYVPFVSATSDWSRSAWKLTDERGNKVTPPLSNLNTYGYASEIGTSAQLYRFDQRPESALPAGATHFVTQLPDRGLEGTFLDWIRGTHREVADTIPWLERNNVAFLFRDGFYAVSVPPDATGNSADTLQVRTLGGRLVYSTRRNPVTGNMDERQHSPVASNYSIRDDVWADIQARERQRERLRALLKV